MFQVIFFFLSPLDLLWADIYLKKQEKQVYFLEKARVKETMCFLSKAFSLLDNLDNFNSSD